MTHRIVDRLARINRLEFQNHMQDVTYEIDSIDSIRIKQKV